MENVWLCPLCESKFDSHEFFARVASKAWQNEQQVLRQLTFAICKECGLVFQWDRYSDEEQEEYYRNGTYRKAVQGTPNITERVMREQALRCEYLLPEIDVEEVRFALDVGASTGYLLKELQDKYECEVLGIEPSEHFRHQSKIKMYSELAMLYTPEYYNAFDLITLIHTLEHVNEPLHLLASLHEFISEDGYLFVEVPNLLKEYTLVISHPVAFTPETVTHALQKTGWEIVWMKEYSGFKIDRTLPANILIKAKPGNVVDFIKKPDVGGIHDAYQQGQATIRQDNVELKKKMEEEREKQAENN